MVWHTFAHLSWLFVFVCVRGFEEEVRLLISSAQFRKMSTKMRKFSREQKDDIHSIPMHLATERGKSILRCGLRTNKQLGTMHEQQ